MRKFNITVNGKTYEVEVEEIGGVATVAAPVAAPAAAAPAAAPAAPKAAPAASAPAGAAKINAPMPGTIVSVNVTEGQSVKSGDILCILEAMKMENEIVAPCAGTVKQVIATKGASVATDEVLAVLG